MQQASRRPPSYPTPTYAQPTRSPSAAGRPPQQARSQGDTPLAPQGGSASSGRATPQRVVLRPLGLQILGVGGIAHAGVVLMTLVVLAVMALGGDSRIGTVTSTIRQQGGGLWAW